MAYIRLWNSLFIGVALIILAGCGSSFEEDKLWNIEPSCKKESTVPVAESGITNPYYNGFMLVREEKDSPYSPYVIDYRYEPQDMTIYGTKRFTDSSNVWYLTQSIDENGRLIGGTKDGGCFSIFCDYSSYTVLNDSEGKIVNLERNHGDETIFNYDQNRLTEVQYLDNRVTEALIYHYNEQSQIVSVEEKRGKDIHSHYFSCNELNQVTAVYVDGLIQFSEGPPQVRNFGHYEFEYDHNGNVAEIREYRHAEVETTTFEYIQTDYPVFNHSLMRLAIGPVWQSQLLIN